MHDEDGDGRLDFEEFFRLSQTHSWLVRDLCVKYCRYVVPRRNGSVADETGKAFDSFSDCENLDFFARLQWDSG